MGKVLRIIGGIGLAILAPYAAPALLGAGMAAATVSAITTAITAIGASIALSAASALLFGPKVPKSQLSRLNITMDPSSPRKAVFGTTALNLDLRYHEGSGTDQEYIDYIIACSAHKIKAISEIWFEEKLAWSSTSGVTSTYTGYLTVATRTEGTSANTISINGGINWGSTRRLTGCSYIHIRIKRSGNDKKTESPLVQGLPSRVTVRGEGALLYDPRRDSTVSGGSGTHRANDQTTWGTYTDPDDCDNPALQLLWWLLGWKINGVLSIGCGVPYTRIDMPSFITAANICDENIALSGGGTQKRYRTSGTASSADDRMEIINTFLACMNGTLRDNNGKLTLTVMKNDLANYTVSFDDNDILDKFEWNQTRGLTETYNVARGRYVDPSNESLYQLVDYPEVRITSPDGIERVVTLDLPFVEDGKRAQRIAKQILQRNQYRGMFSATFTAKAFGCQVGDVIRLTFTPLGWTNKLFRVVSQQIDFTGRVPMALVEENAAIYAWDAEEQAPVTPTAPVVYDPLKNAITLGDEQSYDLADSKIKTFYSTTTPTATTVGDLWYNTSTLIMKRWDGTAWVDTATNGAPTGTSVAGRDASTVASTIKSDGVINTNKVETDSVVANAITTQNTAVTTSNLTLNADTDSDPNNNTSGWNTLQSVTFTATGNPVLIMASAILDVYDDYSSATPPFGSGLMRIRRGASTVLFTSTLYPSAYRLDDDPITYRHMMAPYPFINYVDTPSSGSITYHFDVWLPAGAYDVKVAQNRNLIAIETKR